MKANDKIYAMKTLNKWEMLKRAEVRNAPAEIFQLIHASILALFSLFGVRCYHFNGPGLTSWKDNSDEIDLCIRMKPVKCSEKFSRQVFWRFVYCVSLRSFFAIDQMLTFQQNLSFWIAPQARSESFAPFAISMEKEFDSKEVQTKITCLSEWNAKQQGKSNQAELLYWS